MPVLMTTLVGFDYLLLYGLIVIELVEGVSHQAVEDRPSRTVNGLPPTRRSEGGYGA